MRNRWTDNKAYRVFQSKDVPLNIHDTILAGRHIHYAVSGSDSLPTLIFIHGSPGSWMNYMKFMWDSSMRSKFRIVAFDRPGFGFSDFGQAMHLQEQSDLILKVIKSLKNSKPIYLCGHSLGGPVVIKLAALDPNLFRTVIVVAGSIDANLEKKENWRHIMDFGPLHYLLPGAFAPSNKELLYLKDDLKLLKEDFKLVTCNVKFLHGNKDTWVPIENVGFGIKNLLNAKSITSDTIFGADHQIPWKNRDEMKKLLLNLY